jgi:6-phosphogluconolactonase (cycloisomerase 2 family)
MRSYRANLICLLLLLCPLGLQAQNFIYVNNTNGPSNSISSFSVDTGGVLTSLGTVSTGGVGATVACTGIDRITVNGASNLLFVSNSGDQSISVFRITPATGALTAVVGSPFSSGLTLDSCGGISLASTPDGRFLMASSNGVIKTFSVGVNGALSLSATATLLPSPMVGMKISGDGRFLAVSHQATVSVFTISSVDGSLTAAAGSPFAKTGTGLVTGVEFNCDGTFLYAAEGGVASSITDAWSVAATGALTPLTGSPFTAAGTDSNVVFLSPDNTVLFESNQGSNDMNFLTVNPDGSLSSVGAFNDGLGNKPVGLASDNSGLFIFTANDSIGMDVFNIRPGVVPTLVANTVGGITGANQVHGLAAYPPRSCAHTDFSITQTASPNPVLAGSQITYNITITNNGSTAASVAINDLLPRNFVTFVSCTPGAGAVCDKGAGLNRTITFASLASGQSGSATIVASSVSTLLNGDSISNTSVVSNASAVDSNPANNSATTSVTVSAPPSASKLVSANAAGSYFGTTNLSATLTRVLNSAPVAGRTVTFSILGVVAGTAQTNASGIATLSNVSLAGINAAAYIGGVTVTFAGDSQFQTSNGSSTLTVNKAPLTVTTQNASKVYGDANPAFTYVISGFLNNETVAVVSGTANCNTSASTTSPAGSFPITCSLGTLAATNYSFVFVPATLTITRAPLVLAANNVSRLYGDPNPALTGSVVGLKSTDKANATFAVAAVSTSPVGGYPIIGTVVPLSGFLASNYTITSSGTLTINPAPVTATANNATRVYGDPNPAFTGTLTGAKNGDAVSATFGSTADPTSAVGTYPITATLSGAPTVISNYTVTTNVGTLTVTPAALSVTAAINSRLYGDANPAFSGTITGIKNLDNITATYASTAVAASPVGSYPITPTLVDPTAKLGNYTVTSTNGTLTVNPTPLTVVAANASRLYGDANPSFTGTITGIKNLDNITATYSSTADPTSAVGPFAIVPALADPAAKLGNYSVTSTNGTLTINPAPLTVGGANASRLYGDANPAFTGTVTGIKNADNITATFASTATAASAVGTYPIVPTLLDPTAKLGNYTVSSVNGVLTVNPAALAVSGTSTSRVYGDPNPPFAGSLSGIKNGDNITATFDSTATALSAVGPYAIVPTLVDPTAKLGNYAVTSTNGTLTVTPAALTVSAVDGTRVYGDPNPPFTGSISGVKNSDNITATFASAATAGSPVGTYPITPSLVDPGAKLGNYSVTSTNGTLTVTPAALSVTAGNASRAYGDANPAFAGTITGIKNGDNITATYAGADPTSPVGTYPIVPTLVDPAGKLGNYTVTSTNGTLTVGPAALTVTGGNATRAYGDPNPAFTGTINGIKNGDNITATFTSAAVATSAVGTYPIVPTLADPTAKLSNYAVTSNNGTLTVGAASLTVTAANAKRPFGSANPAFTGTISGIKNGDAITATYASAAIAASPAGTYAILPTLVDPTGKLSNYSITSNSGTLTVIGLPTAVSVTPSSGTATSAVFSAVYSDSSGAGTISEGYMMVNNTISWTGACGIRYDHVANQLFIINDAGNAWLGPITPGAAATVQNSQCVLNGASSSVVAAGNNLTVNFSVSFLPAFTGNKNIYLFAFDGANNLNSGFKLLGTRNLPIPAPTAVSVTPSSGTATSAVFSAVYSDSSGAGTISEGYMMVNNTISWTGACGTRYDHIANQLFIINDAGNAWLGPITPGAAATVQNSQCVLNGASSSVVAAGNNLTVNFSVSFLPAFTGNKNIYLFAFDGANNLNSGFKLLGTRNLPIPAPTAVSVTPSSGTATSAVFSAVYSDASGAGTISEGYMMVNNTISWTGACGTRYDHIANQLFIINDAGNAWLGPITPGAAATVQNSQCVLNGAPSSVVAAGNNLTVNFSVSFLPAFTGNKNIYLFAFDGANNLNSGFKLLGTRNLPIPAPTAVSVTPSSGTATSAVFSAVYSDASGAGTISEGYMMVNNTISWTGACGTRYDHVANQLFIINDAGNAWLGPITPGAAATVQNSQCVLNGATSSVVAAGNNLTVNFSVSFLPAFTGNKNIYLFAFDGANNLNSGFTLLGTWNLP